MPFTFKRLGLNDVILIKPAVFADERGFFLESYKSSDFTAAGIDLVFVQDNHSFSKKNVLRGLHFQMHPKAQGKLIRVVKGAIWDIAVDIRRHSFTFKQWVSETISGENNNMLYIPPGFAHGFIALTDEVHLMYKCTAEYSQENDRGIRWDDPDLAIPWPVEKPIVSEKDRALPSLERAELFM
jgi:dTDP-4-dehydrorhamnose 3,5-epimerase